MSLTLKATDPDLANKLKSKIEFQALRGDNDAGYIGIDDLDFLKTEVCLLEPSAAKPPDTDTTTAMSSTPEPTEPPDSNLSKRQCSNL